jgi:hypothetical protein
MQTGNGGRRRRGSASASIALVQLVPCRPPPAGRANKAMQWPMRPVEARRGVHDGAMKEAGRGGGEEKKGGAHLL